LEVCAKMKMLKKGFKGRNETYLPREENPPNGRRSVRKGETSQDQELKLRGTPSRAGSLRTPRQALDQKIATTLLLEKDTDFRRMRSKKGDPGEKSKRVIDRGNLGNSHAGKGTMGTLSAREGGEK